MPIPTGILAALFAPILEAVGFLEWDIHWKKGGGSAFALNLYKCTLATVGFFSMACFTNNLQYMEYARDWSLQSHSPWGKTAEAEHAILEKIGMNSNLKVVESQNNHEHFQKEYYIENPPAKYIMNPDQLILQREQDFNQPDRKTYWREPPEHSPPQLLQQQKNQQNSLSNSVILEGKQHQQNIMINNNVQDPIQQKFLETSTLKTQNNPQQKIVPNQQNVGHRQLLFFQSEENIHLEPPDKVYHGLENAPPLDSYRPLFFENEHNIPPILLSSLLGIVIGDCAELEALRLIGARRVLVVDTFKPFAAAILANWLLNEPLYTAAYLGMVLTVLGIYFVLMASIERLNVKKKKRRRALFKKQDYSPLNISDGIDNNGNSMTNMQELSEHEVGKPFYLRPLSRHDLSSEYDISINEEQLEADEYMMLFEEERGLTSESICCFRDKGQVRNRISNIFQIDNSEIDLKSNFKTGGSFGSAGSLGAGSWGSFDGIDIDDDLENEDYDTDYFLQHDSIEQSSKTLNQTTQSFSKTPSKSKITTQTNEDWALSASREKTEKTNSPQPPKRQPSGVLKKSRYSTTSLPQKVQPTVYTDDIEKESKKLFNKTQRGSSSTGMNDIPMTISPVIDNMIFAEEKSKQTTKRKPIGSDSLEEAHQAGNPDIPRTESFETTSSASTVVVRNQDDTLPKKKSKVDIVSPPRGIMRSSSSGSCGSFGSFGSSNGSSINSECGPPPGWYINSKESVTGRKIRLRTGYALAFLNVIFDAYGSYLTKKHAVGMTTWEINLLRMGFAAAMMIFLTSFMRFREWKRKKKMRDKVRNEHNYFQASNPHEVEWYKLPKMSIVPWIIVSIGVLFVTFLCPALTNFALMDIPMALAVTLTSVTPLYMIPLSWFMKGEKLTIRGYFGAFIAVLGVIILCIWGTDAEDL